MAAPPAQARKQPVAPAPRDLRSRPPAAATGAVTPACDSPTRARSGRL